MSTKTAYKYPLCSVGLLLANDTIATKKSKTRYIYKKQTFCKTTNKQKNKMPFEKQRKRKRLF